jgi:hypothetical protein
MAAASNNGLNTELRRLTHTLNKTKEKINELITLGDRITIKQQEKLDILDKNLIVIKEKILKLSRHNKSYSKSKSRSKSRSPNLLGGYRQTKNKGRKTRRN